MHTKMFLVRRAGDVSERDVMLLPADPDLDAFLRRCESGAGMKHVNRRQHQAVR